MLSGLRFPFILRHKTVIVGRLTHHLPEVLASDGIFLPGTLVTYQRDDQLVIIRTLLDRICKVAHPR